MSKKKSNLPTIKGTEHTPLDTQWSDADVIMLQTDKSSYKLTLNLIEKHYEEAVKNNKRASFLLFMNNGNKKYIITCEITKR